MARSSPPTARATRSFSSASSGVGAFTEREGKGGSTDDDAVFHLDLRSRWKALDLDHRELVLDFHDFPRTNFLVQLPRSSPVIGCTMATLSRRRLTVLPSLTPSAAARSMTTREVSTKTTYPRLALGAGLRTASVRVEVDAAATEPRGASASGARFSSL